MVEQSVDHAGRNDGVRVEREEVPTARACRAEVGVRRESATNGLCEHRHLGVVGRDVESRPVVGGVVDDDDLARTLIRDRLEALQAGGNVVQGFVGDDDDGHVDRGLRPRLIITRARVDGEIHDGGLLPAGLVSEQSNSVLRTPNGEDAGTRRKCGIVDWMPRRALFFHSQAEAYGSDRSLYLLVTGLKARGWDAEVVLPGDGPLVAMLRGAGVIVHLMDPGVLRRVYRRREWAAFVLWRLVRAIARTWRISRRFDVVHVNTSVVLGAVIGGWLARRPVVLHVRESYAGRERVLRVYASAVAPLIAAVVAISEAIGAELRETALGRRTSVIPNGLLFAAPPSQVNGGSSTLVCVGRINEWKGQEVLVGAVGRLRDAGIAAELLIAGDVYPGGERYMTRLEQRISDLDLTDRIHLLGYVDDVGPLLAGSGIFVLPTTRPEPFGLALVEAMAAGLACVASDHGGPKEIIIDGVSGVLVPPGDEEALADALRSLLSSSERRAELGSAAMVDVRDRYAIDRTVSELARLDEELVRPGRNRFVR